MLMSIKSINVPGRHICNIKQMETNKHSYSIITSARGLLDLNALRGWKVVSK